MAHALRSRMARVCHHKRRKENDMNTPEETLDMMRDEFLRIAAITTNLSESQSASEIRGLCQRAAMDITVRVPLIQQRDNAEREARLWENRYHEQTKLAASYFTNPVDKECICEWPDKTLRKVMVTSVDHGTAHVIWNELHDPIDGQGCVVGMEDTVPVAWLYIPANTQDHGSLPGASVANKEGAE